MQPTWIVVCRAMVLLTCLVALPLAAITGSTGLRRVVPFLDACAEVLRGSANESAAEFPPVAGSPERWQEEHVGTSCAVDGSALSPFTKNVYGESEALPKGREPVTLPVAANANERAGPAASETADAGVAATPGHLNRPDPGISRVAALNAQVVVQGQSDDAREDGALGIAAMERRLRELGATYYVLEKWGEGADRYRFECHVAIATDADHNRYFDATAERPDSAVDAVLRQVERWQSDRTLR